MEEPRLVPGERLSARLAARSAFRARIGVSSRFFARFGLTDPWACDEDPRGGTAARPWAAGYGREGGVLGAFWDLLERRFLRYLRFGVLFRGGLGGAFDLPWADWLWSLDGDLGLWREHALSPLGRLGGGARRARSPWGAYASPDLLFVAAPFEEEAPEEPAHATRFRRRTRRARAVATPLAFAAAAPVREGHAPVAAAPAERPAPPDFRPAPAAGVRAAGASPDRGGPGRSVRAAPPVPGREQPPVPGREQPPVRTPVRPDRDRPALAHRALPDRALPDRALPDRALPDRAHPGAPVPAIPRPDLSSAAPAGARPGPLAARAPALPPRDRSDLPAGAGGVRPSAPALRSPRGLARAFARAEAPAVGSPALLRALGVGLPAVPAMVAPGSASLGTLLDPLAWAEQRGGVTAARAAIAPRREHPRGPAAAVVPGGAPAPVAPGPRSARLASALRGLPPEGARALRPVLLHSPLLAFVLPPEPADAAPDRPAPPAGPRRAVATPRPASAGRAGAERTGPPAAAPREASAARSADPAPSVVSGARSAPLPAPAVRAAPAGAEPARPPGPAWPPAAALPATVAPERARPPAAALPATMAPERARPPAAAPAATVAPERARPPAAARPAAPTARRGLPAQAAPEPDWAPGIEAGGPEARIHAAGARSLRPGHAPSAHAASRLLAASPAAPSPYQALRQVGPALRSLAPAQPGAVARLLAHATGRSDPEALPRWARDPSRALDQLLVRALRAPGRIGREEAAAAWPTRGLPLSATASSRVIGAQRLGRGSPLLAFVARLAATAVLPGEQEAGPATAARPRAVGRHAVEPRQALAARPAARPSAAARALLRAAPAQVEGSVVPALVARPIPGAADDRLSSSAFPGRALVVRTRGGPAATQPFAIRGLQPPWLPLDSVVVAEAPEAAARAAATAPGAPRPAREGGPPRVSRTARPAIPRPAPRGVEPALAPQAGLPAPRPPTPLAPRGVLPPSARAAARLAEAAPPPAGSPRAAAPPAERRDLPSAPQRRSPPARAASSAPERRAAGASALPSGTEHALLRLIDSQVLGDARASGLRSAATGAVPLAASGPALLRAIAATGRTPETLWLQGRSPSVLPGGERPAPGARAPAAAWSGIPGMAGLAAWSPLRRQPSAGGEAGPWYPGLVPPSPVLLALPPRAALAEPAAAGPAGARSAGVHPSEAVLGRLGGRSRAERRLLALVAPEAPGEVAAAGTAAAADRRRAAAGAQAAPRGRGLAPARARRGRPATIDALLGAGVASLVPALAGVAQPDAALQLVLERALGLGGSGRLPAPVQRLVEQVRRIAEEAPGEAVLPRRPARAAPAREGLQRRKPAARKPAAAAAPTPASATVHHVQASYRIAGLVRKLEQLIHLVDVEHRLAAARAQVRMAEDSAAARPGPGAGVAEESRDQEAGQDVEALVKRIVEDVQDQFSSWAMQRPEEPVADGPWW